MRSAADKPSAPLLPRAVASLALVVALLSPMPAQALQLPSDSVDGRSAVARKLSLASLPDVTMKSGALVDGDGRVLWARFPDQKRPMASITKIMTAVVALEHAPLDEQIVVPTASGAVGQSTAYLRPGEKLSLHDLLAALLVKSGNDAAVAIAQGIGGSQDAFVQMMNDKAAELGLTNTHFMNPHGLDQSGHYSTATDLAVLARYAMSKQAFRDIVSMKQVQIGSGARKEVLQSTDLLIGNYQGAMGVKTGYTSGAGYSVISAAQREGVTLYTVVLGTNSDAQRFKDAAELLDWGFAHYRPQQIGTQGTVIAEAPVGDYLDVTVPAAMSADTTAAILDLEGPVTRTVTVATVRAPVNLGDAVGVATFTQAGKVIGTVPLVSTQHVGRPNPFLWVWIQLVRGWRKVFGASAITLWAGFSASGR